MSEETNVLPDTPSGDLVQVTGLRVLARQSDGSEAEIVNGVSFSVPRGEVLALIGEAGAGKTAIALALLGHARTGCRIAGGSVRVGDTEVLGLDEEGLHGLRGRVVSYVPQGAASAFNPSRRIIDQVIEGALIHGLMSREAAEAKAVALFDALGLPDPARIGMRYPHQVSASHQQRLMAAMALITDPLLVVLDEPTTVLDVTARIDVLQALKRVLQTLGTAAVFVSRDLAVAAQMADRILVLDRGTVREYGATEQVLRAPDDAYTHQLLDAATPSVHPVDATAALPAPLLDIRDLMAGYGARDSRGRPAIRVLEAVDLVVRRGMAVGVVGESGSGKTTLARVVAGMVAPTPGSTVRFDGAILPPTTATRSPAHARRIQILFQNGDAVLNPAHRIGDIIGRPLTYFRGLKADARRERVRQLLELVGLPASLAERRSGDLSSGQKQRVNLARALGAEPDLIVCDDITSALDPVAGAQLLGLLAALRRTLGLSYLFISHDLAAMRAVCDEIVVLYGGRTVETGERDAMVDAPFHPYTYLLISSAPALREGWLDALPGLQPLPPVGPSSGADLLCPFVRRCPVRIDGRCNSVAPPTRRLPGKDIFCHREAAELLRWQAPAGTMQTSAQVRPTSRF